MGGDVRLTESHTTPWKSGAVGKQDAVSCHAESSTFFRNLGASRPAMDWMDWMDWMGDGGGPPAFPRKLLLEISGLSGQ